MNENNTDLLELTRAMLLSVWGRGPGGGVTAAEIADGANVNREWVHKFAQGRIADPSVRRVQRVHDYLASRLSGRAN